MKGLIVSQAAFVAYVFGSMVASHIRKPAYISRIFIPCLLVASVLYVLVYAMTPSNLGFLPATWLAHPPALDLAFGAVILLLNAHSYVDFFFGFNGGFSMSLMLEILRRQERGATTDELVKCYTRPDGFDKIYGWRLPRLERSGLITVDRTSGTCTLTPAGLRIARFGLSCKRLFNLGVGG